MDLGGIHHFTQHHQLPGKVKEGVEAFGVDGEGVLEDEESSPVVTRDENRLEQLAQASEQLAQPEPLRDGFCSSQGLDLSC